jgi:hypothetical protein
LSLIVVLHLHDPRTRDGGDRSFDVSEGGVVKILGDLELEPAITSNEGVVDVILDVIDGPATSRGWPAKELANAVLSPRALAPERVLGERLGHP